MKTADNIEIVKGLKIFIKDETWDEPKILEEEVKQCMPNGYQVALKGEWLHGTMCDDIYFKKDNLIKDEITRLKRMIKLWEKEIS